MQAYPVIATCTALRAQAAAAHEATSHLAAPQALYMAALKLESCRCDSVEATTEDGMLCISREVLALVL